MATVILGGDPPPFGDMYVGSPAGVRRYSMPGWRFVTNAAQVLSVAHAIRLWPIFISRRRAFDRIGINVAGNASAGRTARCGLYTAIRSIQGYVPDQLTVQSSEFDCSTTGAKEEVIDLIIPEGFYFTALVDNNGEVSYTIPLAAAAQGPVTGAGFSIAGVFDSIGYRAETNVAGDYPANGLPDPIGTLSIAQGFGPMVRFGDSD